MIDLKFEFVNLNFTSSVACFSVISVIEKSNNSISSGCTSWVDGEKNPPPTSLTTEVPRKLLPNVKTTKITASTPAAAPTKILGFIDFCFLGTFLKC